MYQQYYWDYQEQLRRRHIQQLRHTYSVLGWTLLAYTGIMIAAILAVELVGFLTEILMSAMQGGSWEMQNDTDGWGYLLSGVVGLVLLLLWRRAPVSFGAMWKRNRPMRPWRFIQILSIFMGIQMVYIILSMLAEMILNRFGLTVNTDAMDLGDGFSLFLYAGLGAPVTEEILFRGLVLRAMEPQGKRFAILMSALLFGLFHGNLSQGLFAFGAGVVMGYVALEYNILWAMVLHMFNNLMIADSLPRLSKWLPEGGAELLLLGILMVFTVIAVASVIVHRKSIKAYFQKGKDDPDCAKAFWSAPGIVVMTVLMGVAVAESLLTSICPL